MVVHNTMKKATAEMKAKKYRKMGYNVSIFKKDKGYGVSVTKKK